LPPRPLPRPFDHVRPLLFRSPAVQPVVPRDEIAARIADDWHPGFLDLLHHVAAEAARISQWRSRLIDACVDCPPEMFEKRAKSPAIDIGADARLLDDRTRGTA